jgi:hypothetical protein
MGFLSGVGGFLGAGKEGQGYKKAEEMWKKYGKTAEETQNRVDPFAPYRDALAERLSGIVSGEIDFTTDPGYQWRLQQGQQATERAASARGFNMSGNVMGALGQQAQGFASTEYNNIIGRLANLSGATGAGAAGGQAYADVKRAAVEGRTGARINRGYAQSRGIGSLFGGMEGGVNDAGSIASMASSFSDRALKENIKPVGKLDNGLTVYVWDWTEEAKKLVGDQPTLGVIAQEVQEVAPEAVIEDDSGYLKVNYGALYPCK